MTLSELAAKVEALDRPDRDVDKDIGCDVFGYPRNDPVPKPYTASLDAAMTLADNDQQACSALIDAISNNREDNWREALPRYVTAELLRAKDQANG